MKEENSKIDQLRQDARPDTEHRRKIAGLAAVGMVDFSLISLYQLGYIKHMPDLPGEVFDSDKVNASEEAVLLGLPDGVVSLGMYAATIFLAAVGSAGPKKNRWADWLLGGIVLGQAAGGAYYLYNMAAVQKKVCLYCVTGALINFTAVKPALALLNISKNQL
jgi:uncharacterized membrane protein